MQAGRVETSHSAWPSSDRSTLSDHWRRARRRSGIGQTSRRQTIAMADSFAAGEAAAAAASCFYEQNIKIATATTVSDVVVYMARSEIRRINPSQDGMPPAAATVNPTNVFK